MSILKPRYRGAHGYQKPNGTIDHDYFGRVMFEIQGIAQARGLQRELNTDEMMRILSSDEINDGRG